MTDRDTTKQMFTHMINMMEQHDTMVISCGDPLMELLKDVRELLKEQEATIEILVKDITFHNCNNCNREDCESKPNAGQPVRSNCIYWLEGR